MATKEIKTTCGVDSPPWQLRLTEPTASEANAYLHFGDREGARERDLGIKFPTLALAI